MSTYPITRGPLRMVHPQLEALLNAAIDGVIVFDQERRIRLMSRKAERMFGCREIDLLGLQLSELLPGFATGVTSEQSSRHPVTGDTPVRLEGVRRDRTAFAAELTCGHIHGIDPPRFIAFVRDVSDRVQRELELARSEAALHTAQRLTNIGNYVINYHSESPDYASPQLRRMFNWNEQQPIDHILEKILAVVHPADQLAAMQAFAELETQRHSIDIEYRILSITTGLRYIHHLVQMSWDAAGQPAQQVGTVHDITERKIADYEFRNMHSRVTHFGRVSTMGEMATGIAHEINQPLTAIAIYAQTCRRMFLNNEYEAHEIADTLDQIAQQALRAGEVIRRMRAFAKYHEAKLETMPANRMLEELVQLAQTDAHFHSVRLSFEAAAENPVICADAVQIQQVLLNLVRNAIDAMHATSESRREILLRARVSEQDEVEFMVADRGTGLSPEIAAAAFNAFFTTKSSGTGLGLSISQSIIKAHGGRLWCTDNPGGGACFYFSLARSE
jgi:two-component system, LuxR family, sensor kinase FixL